MMRKILILINVQLKDAFQGLEEGKSSDCRLAVLLPAFEYIYKFVYISAESKSDEALRVLVPPGNDPPPPLGGLTMPITSYGSTKRPELLLMCNSSTLMNCCSTMLSCSYPVQVSYIIHLYFS